MKQTRNKHSPAFKAKVCKRSGGVPSLGGRRAHRPREEIHRRFEREALGAGQIHGLEKEPLVDWSPESYLPAADPEIAGGGGDGVSRKLED